MSWEGMLKIAYFRGRLLFLAFYEMFQRFNFYGFQAIMFLFLKHELDLQLHNAIGVYHVYVGLSCLVPLIGTLAADLYMNKVLSLLLMAFYALVGNILMVMASTASEEWDLTNYILDHLGTFVIFALFFRALGGGGAREIIKTLGDDQFVLPEEEEKLFHFHQLLSIFLTFGTIMAFLVPPVLRMHLECFGKIYCFSAAFGIPAVFMLLAGILLMAGYRRLKPEIPRESVMVEFILCVVVALGNRDGGGAHWIDNASHVYYNEFLDDMQETLPVLVMFLPLPIFWALYEQAGSRWVHQATNMQGTLSRDLNWYVEPDQMQVIIPIVIFIVMPIFEHLLYPLCEKCNFLRTPKQRMFLGSFLAILAFVAGGLVEWKNEDTQVPNLVPGEGEFAVWNMFGSCAIQVTTNVTHLAPFFVDPMGQHIATNVPVTGVQPFTYHIVTTPTERYNCSMSFEHDGNASLAEKHTVGIVNLYVFKTNHETQMKESTLAYPHDMVFRHSRRCDLQLPRIGVIYYTGTGLSDHSSLKQKTNWAIITEEVVLQGEWEEKGFVKMFLDPNHNSVDFFHARPTNYDVKRINPIPADKKKRVPLSRGEVGILMVKTSSKLTYNYTRVHGPLTEPMWLQMPQYILIAMAAYLFPYTMLEYSYTQVSPRMRPVLTSFWLISIALGNFLVAIFSFSNIFKRELWNYAFYAVFMFSDCLLLIIVLFSYVPSVEDTDQRDEEESASETNPSSDSGASRVSKDR